LIVYTFTPQAESPYPKLSYNITILKPDSTTYGKFENLSVFNGGSRVPGVMYLLNQPIDIGLEERDPLGIYRLQIEVSANGRKIMSFSDLAFEVTP
jgi:hypothetical protein